jgi:hypothetical protein
MVYAQLLPMRTDTPVRKGKNTRIEGRYGQGETEEWTLCDDARQCQESTTSSSCRHDCHSERMYGGRLAPTRKRNIVRLSSTPCRFRR